MNIKECSLVAWNENENTRRWPNFGSDRIEWKNHGWNLLLFSQFVCDFAIQSAKNNNLTN